MREANEAHQGARELLPAASLRLADLSRDLDAIILLDRAINERDRSSAEDEYRGFLGTLMVADVDSAVIGVVSLSPERWNRITTIEHLAVVESHRRKGAGRKLIREVVNVASQAGAWFVAVQTALWNYGGIEFYKSCGFRPRAVLPDYFGDGNDMVWLDLDCRGRA